MKKTYTIWKNINGIIRNTRTIGILKYKDLNLSTVVLNTETFLRKEFQRVCIVTSNRFVPEPFKKSVQADILIKLRGFKNVVRWK